MNHQQLAAVKQAVEALKECRCDPRLKYEHPFYDKVITDLEEVIAQDALHKMAEESRTSGLRLDDWDKIGCVNHDCDQCKAVQEPVRLQCTTCGTVYAYGVPPQVAQQEPLTDIYRSFEQWKNGNVLEHGVPRIEYYSEAQLDLVEMGWNYGYDAGRAVEQALDKKAENARELGLSYDPEHDTVDIADIIAGELKVSRGTAYDMMREVLAEEFPPDPCCASGTSCNAPKPWVGLTDEEKEAIYRQADAENWHDQPLLEAVEAKLKEKNT